MRKITKQFDFEIKTIDQENHIIRGIFSSGTVDRQGEIVDQKSWNLDNFLKNPVVLFAHDHYTPAVGRVVELMYDAEGNLAGEIQFAVEANPLAETLWKLYSLGYMKGWSVGFGNGSAVYDDAKGITILRDNELYEISAVNVPAHQIALAYSKGIDASSIEKAIRLRKANEKGAIPFHDYGIADETAEWNGPMQMSECGDDMEKLKDICAWFDETAPDVKSSYKLPHHQASDKKAVWKGVAAAMGAVLGGRGGVDMPEEDRQAVYNHLAKHYQQFEKEVPEFKAITAQIEKSPGGILSPKSRQTIESTVSALKNVLRTDDESRKADNQVKQWSKPHDVGGKKGNSVRSINKAVGALLQANRALLKTKSQIKS